MRQPQGQQPQGRYNPVATGPTTDYHPAYDQVPGPYNHAPGQYNQAPGNAAYSSGSGTVAYNQGAMYQASPPTQPMMNVPPTQPVMQETHATRDVKSGAEKERFLWTLTWFVSGILSFFTAIGAMIAIGFVLPVNFVECGYLALFSFIVFMQSCPFCKTERHEDETCVDSMKIDIGKYFNFLERYTYKGMVFMYIGASEISFYMKIIHNGISWAGTLLGFFVVLVGIATTVKGVLMTCKLRSLKGECRRQKNIIEQYFARSAQGFGEISPLQFLDMARQVEPDVYFSQVELMQTFKALTPFSHPNAVSRRQLAAWTDDGLGIGMTWL